MRRRSLLQLFLSAVAALPLPGRILAQTRLLTAADEMRIRAIGDAVLPSEIAQRDRDAVIDAFFAWLRDHRVDADAGHGYGVTRLRKTAASPAERYRPQLEALEEAARDRGRAFVDLPRSERLALLEAAIVQAKIERLPARPDGGHIATDLMGFYFNGIQANDLAYRARIGRDTCRTLAGSESRPAQLASRPH